MLQFSRRQCDDNSELTTAESEPAQDFSGQGSLTIKDALLIGCNGVRRRGLGRYRICDVLAPGSPPLSSYPGRVAFNRPRSDGRTSVGGRPLVLFSRLFERLVFMERLWCFYLESDVESKIPGSRTPALPCFRNTNPTPIEPLDRNQHKQTVFKDKG